MSVDFLMHRPKLFITKDGVNLGCFYTLLVREAYNKPWYTISPYDPIKNDYYTPIKGELILTNGEAPVSITRKVLGLNNINIKGVGTHRMNISIRPALIKGDTSLLILDKLLFINIENRTIARGNPEKIITAISTTYYLDEDNGGIFDAWDGQIIGSPGT